MTDTNLQKEKKIIDYLVNPPEKGMSSIGMLVDFEENKLAKMIDRLTKKEKISLWEKVETVCIQWNTARICPAGGIGTVARYQTAKLILDKELGL